MSVDKLVDSVALDSNLTSIASAIRAKGGTSSQLAFPSGFISAIQSIPSGGGGSADHEGKIIFIDYDGTVLYEYTQEQFESVTALPSNPSHERLSAQGWNWTLSEIQDYIEDYPTADVVVGQIYDTISGATEIDFTLEAPYLSPYLAICINGEIEIDWGDNSNHDIVTGTSISTRIYIQHTYNVAGNYTISIYSNSGSYGFINNGSNYLNNILNAVNTNNSINYYNSIYSSTITAIYYGSNVTLNTYSAANLYNLKKMTLASDISISSSYIFNGNFKLQALVIPRHITLIYASFLSKCYSLLYCALHPLITDIHNGAFADTFNLKTITLSDNLTRLRSSIFNTSGLKYITLTQNITALEGTAFNGCNRLNKIYNLSQITTINSNTFASCYNLDINDLSFSNLTSLASSAFTGVYRLTSVTIPSTITEISSDTFNNCQNLKEISLPNGLTTIGTTAFGNCRSLINITLPSTLTSVGYNAFNNCYSLQSLSIPQSVLSFGAPSSTSNGGFQYCYSLTTLNIPCGISMLGSSFFYGCYALKNIPTLLNTITTIPNSCFYGCYSLQSITLPTTVTSIGNNAFYNCYSLRMIIIPSTVTSIGIQAFCNCYNITEYHFQSTTPPTITSTNVFSSINSNCVIYVPYSSDHSVLNAYKTANYWSTYASYMQEEPQ